MRPRPAPFRRARRTPPTECNGEPPRRLRFRQRRHGRAAARCRPGRPGRRPSVPLRSGFIVRLVFHLPLRQTKGLLSSPLDLIDGVLPVPGPTWPKGKGGNRHSVRQAHPWELLHARTLPGQPAEAAVGITVLNRMIEQERPTSVRVHHCVRADLAAPTPLAHPQWLESCNGRLLSSILWTGPGVVAGASTSYTLIADVCATPGHQSWTTRRKPIRAFLAPSSKR